MCNFMSGLTFGPSLRHKYGTAVGRDRATILTYGTPIKCELFGQAVHVDRSDTTNVALHRARRASK